MSQYNLLNNADIEPLGEKVFTVLEKVGVLCQNREMLEAMKRGGAKVDYAREVATFPKQFSDTSTRQVPGETLNKFQRCQANLFGSESSRPGTVRNTDLGSAVGVNENPGLAGTTRFGIRLSGIKVPTCTDCVIAMTGTTGLAS